MAARSRMLRVLVVDEDALLCWAIGQTLAAAGCDVSVADSLDAARDVFATGSPDAALIGAPGVKDGGLAVLSEVRQRAPRCAVIVMTAAGTAELVQQARALGARAVLFKPFDMLGLAAAVVNACRQPLN